MAIEYEEPIETLERFRRHGVRVNKVHLSSALALSPTPEALSALAAFDESVYLHQVIARGPDGRLTRWKDLPEALTEAATRRPSPGEEWRIHYHIPLHHKASGVFRNTTDHLLRVLEFLAGNPGFCAHLEMETYTWEVLPPGLRNRSVIDQLAGEYAWCLEHLRGAKRG
jgi:hypothetical protein